MSTLTQDEIRPFVLAAHGNLAQVRALLAKRPELLNAVYQEWDESALAAAAHTGQREIAGYLLEAGAPLTICAAAMLGDTPRVAAFVEADPAQANARGAHGISLMFHVALGGQPEMAQFLLDHGGGDRLRDSVHGAVAAGHTRMAAWLLDHGADVNALDWQGQTPLAAAEALGLAEMADLLRARGGLQAPPAPEAANGA